MKKLYPILFVLFSLYGPAQSWSWAKGPTLSNGTYFSEVKVASNGDVLVAGTFSNTINLGGIQFQSSGDVDIVLARYTSAGGLIWAKHFAGTSVDWVLSMDLDAQDNILISGLSQSPGLQYGSLSLPCNGAFLHKLDGAGNLIWQNSVKGNIWVFKSAKFNAAGQVLAVGAFYDTLTIANNTYINKGNYDAVLCKFSASGQALWARVFSDDLSDNACDLELDPNGNIYVSGDFKSDSLHFGNGVAVAGSASLTAYVCKFDSAGSALWALSLGTSSYEDYPCQLVYAGGILCMSGTFKTNTLTIGTHSVLGTWNYTYNVSFLNTYVTGISGSGNVLWAKCIGGNFNMVNAVTADAAGNFLVGGVYNPYLITIGNQTYIDSLGGFNFFMGSFAPNGNLLWSRVEGNTGDSNILQGLDYNPNGELFVSGYHVKPLALGTTTLQNINQLMGSAFVAKLGNSTTAIGRHSVLNALNFYPNPSAGIVHFSNLSGSGKLQLYSSTGSLLMETKLQEGFFELDLDAFAPGCYQLVIVNKESVHCEKLILTD